MWGSTAVTVVTGLGKATTNTTSVESGLTYNLIKTRFNSFIQGIGMHVLQYTTFRMWHYLAGA